MSATMSGIRPEELAQDLFNVIVQFFLTVPRSRHQAGELKEIELLTLSLLRRQDYLIVGDIQRSLGVLPAQMSRVIRALEDRPQPLIACRINASDKRKIDVTLTPAGQQAYHDYQDARVRRLATLLAQLTDEDVEEVQHLLDKVQDSVKSPAR